MHPAGTILAFPVRRDDRGVWHWVFSVVGCKCHEGPHDHPLGKHMTRREAEECSKKVLGGRPYSFAPARNGVPIYLAAQHGKV